MPFSQPTHELALSQPLHATEVITDTQMVLPTYTLPLDLPTIPGYQVLQLFAHGGMSNVYLAKQEKLNRLVAVKMIRPQDSLDDRLRKRFIREASAIAALQHPNVVQIHEIGETNGILFLSLEYISGGNLETKIKRQLPSPRESAIIVRQLAEAMQVAHEHRIIHRDLKPANVLWVEPEPMSGQTTEGSSRQRADEARIAVKITDFGLAKSLFDNSDQTRPDCVIGTPSFMSPEQARGQSKDVGESADIYGLGAILYMLLTGKPPFLGATPIDTLQKVRNDPPVSPRQVNALVPKDLERVCLCCLEKEPELRYASARELAFDLSRFLQGLPVAAHPIGYLKRVRRYFARYPLRTLAAAGFAVALAACVAAFSIANRASEDLKGRDRELEAAKANIAAISLPPGLIVLVREDPMSEVVARKLADEGDESIIRLARDFPDEFAVQYCAGAAQLILEQPAKAWPYFEKAKFLAEELAKGQEGLELLANLAVVRERLGDIHVWQKDREAAINEYERAITLRELVYGDAPQARWAEELAAICGKQAELFAEKKEWASAILFCERRIKLLNDLHAKMPELTEKLVASHERMVVFLRKIDNGKAADFYQKEAERLLNRSN